MRSDAKGALLSVLVLTLLIDNYDSYTFNLFQLLAEVNGEEPIVVRNDAYRWEELAGWRFDNIVISPGPGHPGLARDFGICADAIREADVPLLGVCLGHQGLAQVHGGTVGPAPRVMHGQLSRITHSESGLFAGLPQNFAAVRYHSLAVVTMPPRLQANAWADDGVVMAIQDRYRPSFGLQFHPESICTEHGCALLRNFRDITQESFTRRRRAPVGGHRAGRSIVPKSRGDQAPARAYTLIARKLGKQSDPEAAFLELFADATTAFWLDGAASASAQSRFSFMGDSSGPLSQTVEYDVDGNSLTVRRDGSHETLAEDVLSYARRELRNHACNTVELPFEFNCGFVGYLGYELKQLCGAVNVHESDWPDAHLIFVDRMVVFDHQEDDVHLLALAPRDETGPAEQWVAETARRLMTMRPAPPPESPTDPTLRTIELRFDRSASAYREAIRQAQQLIDKGETYEVCLSNEIRTTASPDPLLVHRLLRRSNPAPYSAYLRFGDHAVVSSSPERYLKVDVNRGVETKPIKGTALRSADHVADRQCAEALSRSDKDRAENLMIVDLLRNDLGLVCEIGSVAVPKLMHVETYSTVHQLVSTVTGKLRTGLDAIDCVQASFPGGSMTGAPKLRTMEIIDELEGRPRGVYSGTIAALGVNGSADMSIVIRTVTIDPTGARIGAGGAIVAASDPQAEFDEMLLKARALVEAIALATAGRPNSYRLLDPEVGRTEPDLLAQVSDADGAA